jgi:hypothetical protein
MFVSAAVNVFVALNYNPATWAAVMATYGIVSKLALLVVTFLALRLVARQRLRAMGAPEREALLAGSR